MAKNKKKSKRKDKWADAPDRVPPPAPPGFLCTRCGAGLTSAAQQDDHNMATHLYMLDGISEGRPGGSIADLHQGGAQRGRNLHAAAHGRAVRLARPEARPDGPPRHGARLTARRTHKTSPDGIILDQRQPEWHTVVLRRTKRLRLGSGR
jgi:hypothetical protein